MAAISSIGGRFGRPLLGTRFLLATTIVCIVGAAAICADTLRLTVTYFQPLFFWDQWATVDNYRSIVSNTYRISDLFSQHNEHRIVLPRLIFLTDFVFGRGLNIINICTVFIIQLLHATLIARIARRLNTGFMSIISIAIVFILLFSFGQAENFLWGFQVQFVGVYAAATAALWCYARAIEQQKNALPFLGFAIGAAFMAIVATYTMSNGVICGVVMIFLGLSLRTRAATTAGTVLITAALLLSYFIHSHIVPYNSPPSVLIQHPLNFIAYFLVYIGGLAGSSGVTAAGVFGALGLSLTLFAATRMILRGEDNSARATLVGVMIFIVLTAGVTAFGRVFFGLDQALSSRYFTPVAVFWAAQVVYWSSFAPPTSRNWRASAIFVAVSLAVVTGAVRGQLALRSYASGHFRNLNLASDALLSRVDVNDAMRLVYPDPQVPKRLAPFLDDQHLSIFSWPEARLGGMRLSAAFSKIDDQACLGAFDSAELSPESDAVAAIGWAWDRVRRTSVKRVVLVDSHDMIVGFASGGWSRPDVRRALPEVRSKRVGWSGFAKVPGREPIRAYADLNDGSAACLVGDFVAPADDRIGAQPVEADLSTLGAVIEAAGVLSGGWTLNGQEPVAGAPSVMGAVYGSWSGNDANQGETNIGPFTAPGGAFALPIVTGPSTGGQSITVKDADTNEVYIHFRSSVRTQWGALVLTVPPEKASRRLLVVAADHGSNWGQWMAIGEPHVAGK